MKLILAALLICATSQAVTLRDLSLNYRRFDPSNRMPDLNGFTAKDGLTLNVDTDLFYRFYWNSRVVALTDNGGYKLVGLNFHLGVRVFSTLNLEYEHFSKHLLDHDDSGFPQHKFPVEDSFGIVWTLYSDKTAPVGVF